MFLRGFPSMTLEASVELERIAAQVREDALLLDLVQSTPIGGLLDGLHREARADAVVAEIEPFSDRESYRQPAEVFPPLSIRPR